MEHIEKIDHNTLQATEIGIVRMASPETGRAIRQLVGEATARGKNGEAMAVCWLAMMLCSDERGGVWATEDEIAEFINSRLDFLTRRVREAMAIPTTAIQ